MSDKKAICDAALNCLYIAVDGVVAKDDDKFYRARVERYQKRRWNLPIVTDGYKLSRAKVDNQHNSIGEDK